MRVSVAARAAMTAVSLLALASPFAGFPVGALAQNYPAKSIRLIIDTAPGGVTDILGRMSAESLATQSGRQVVVENKSGSSGHIALDYLAHAPGDGYTLMIVGGGNLVIQPFLQKSLPFDPLNDFLPVFNVAETPHILVVPQALPAGTVAEFVAYAKSNPGKVNYGSAGIGSPPHLSGYLFARTTGLNLTHVPYKGVAGTMPDLVAGRIQLVSMSLGSARTNLKAGTLKALATAARKRLGGLSDVPTAAEAGIPGWDMSAWFGVFSPRDASPEIVRYINSKLQTWVDDPKTRARFLDIGAEPVGGSAAAFADRVRSDFKYWGQVIKESGITLD
jgi:tripartite-type tricarboxylate transporter receptor subunit TctC